MAKKRKKTLSLDFDGVINSYKSGWQGPRVIPDEPVSGALEFIVTALDRFEVNIFSSRSRYIGGRRAMKQWLKRHYWALGMDWDSTPQWFKTLIAHHGAWEPPPHDLDQTIRWILRQIKFPTFKPPATIGLDDRVLTFNGLFPSMDELDAFKPWNKR